MLGETEIPQKMEVTPGAMETRQKVKITPESIRKVNQRRKPGSELAWCFRILGPRHRLYRLIQLPDQHPDGGYSDLVRISLSVYSINSHSHSWSIRVIGARMYFV